MANNQTGMVVTILGSGTCVPSLKRSSCSMLLECGPDKIVFDMGPGTMRRLLENGTRIQDITHVFLSHFHPDHCAELVSFLFALKSKELYTEDGHLTLVGGHGLAHFFNGLKAVFGRWIDLGEDRFTLVEMNTNRPDERVFPHFYLTSTPVEHNPESLAYRVLHAGKSVVYSGDTDVSENLVDLAQNAHLMVCESAGTDENKPDKHLSPSLAGWMADRAGVETLVLTHFYPECEKTDIAKQCRKTYDGNLFLAEDLMKISL